MDEWFLLQIYSIGVSLFSQNDSSSLMFYEESAFFWTSEPFDWLFTQSSQSFSSSSLVWSPELEISEAIRWKCWNSSSFTEWS